MTSVHNDLNQLKRPKLLLDAARFGLGQYDRARTLPRILGRTPPERPDLAITALLDREAQVERTRKTGGMAYSPAAHIGLLTAILAEARRLAPAGGQP